MIALQRRPTPAPRVQRKATAGGSSPVAARCLEGGRPLEGAVRSQMEAGFGRDFSQVRIHDGPAAADAARSVDALAYAVGNDVVFGAGQYRPTTPAGAGLLAHELAHTVQQGGQPIGPQHKALAATGASDRLEAEADRAADAVVAGGRAPPLTRLGAPMLLRAKKAPASTPTASATAPKGMTLVNPSISPGADVVEVVQKQFTLPLPKGKGAWVAAAYRSAASEGRLVFTTNDAAGDVPAWKEEGSSGEYKRVWLANLGFSKMNDLAVEIKKSADKTVTTALKNAAVAKAVDGMETDGLAGSGFDIDHIVEKQIGGTSIPTNLHLLPSKKNQDSGVQTYNEVVKLVAKVRANFPQARRVQIRFAKIDPAIDSEDDAGFLIETFLRAGKIKDSKEIQIDAQKVPVTITAGGMGETLRVGPDETPFTTLTKRIVPGMRLVSYKRGKTAKKGTPAADTVQARLDTGAQDANKQESGSKAVNVPLIAELSTDTGRALAPKLATEVGGTAAKEDLAAATAGEWRKLKFGTPKPANLPFYYPYLSPGTLTSYQLADDGSVAGEGFIQPTLKFLPRVNIHFGKGMLAATAPLDAKKFASPVPLIHFTEGALSLVLADETGPKFTPSGQLKFFLGTAAKPLINGVFNATVKDNRLAATGTLTPAQAIPGIRDASGDFAYDQTNGWSGKLTATSAKIPNSVANVTLSFAQEGGRFVTRAEGAIETTIRGDKKVRLAAEWGPAGLIYTGELDWPKPFPIVDNVHLKGRYAEDQLDIRGDTGFTFQQWRGAIHVRYLQKGQEAGKLSGHGQVDVETRNKKAKGKLNVDIDDTGSLTGEGKLAYQLTEKVTPELGVRLAKGGHLTILGSVSVADFEVFRKWPEKGGERELIKASMHFPMPIPPLPVNAVITIKAGVGIAYGIGPGKVTGLKLAGEFDPLEENPNIKASLTGKFVVPTFFDLTGSLSARLGLEVAGGAFGIDGGVTVKPSVGISADAIVAIDAKYEKGAFDFTGKAFVEATPHARLGIDLVASIYGLWHGIEYEMTYPVKEYAYDFPSKLKLNVGEVGYSTAGGMRWPKLSDISLEPAEISPLEMMKSVMGKAKAKEKGA